MYEQLPHNDDFNVKVNEFTSAITKYNAISAYTEFERILAIIVVVLQVLSIKNLVQTFQFQGLVSIIIVLILCYLATDFFNGLVHMIVDNNTNYSSLVGPFIAAFHMHHYKMRYQEKHALKIYFTESGHKFWLVVYLILLTTGQNVISISPNFNLGLVAFGTLSSFAEVSHFWCHNATKSHKIIAFLQRHRVLLSLNHHRLHHVQDNTHYAFLNGVSDPLLNIIASKCYKGYKNHSDKHVATYIQRLNPPAIV
jgi:hypothetical protein